MDHEEREKKTNKIRRRQWITWTIAPTCVSGLPYLGGHEERNTDILRPHFTTLSTCNAVLCTRDTNHSRVSIRLEHMGRPGSSAGAQCTEAVSWLQWLRIPLLPVIPPTPVFCHSLPVPSNEIITKRKIIEKRLDYIQRGGTMGCLYLYSKLPLMKPCPPPYDESLAGCIYRHLQ